MLSLRTLICCAALAGLPVSLGYADTAKVEIADRGLITAKSAIPDTAEDSRDDGILRDASGRPVTHDLLGKQLPEFETETADGTPFSTDELKGRWTVMTVWGVWCHDSRNDAENIAAVAEHYAAHPDIGFVSLHVPHSREYFDRRFRDFDSVNAFFDDRELSWPTILDESVDIREALNIVWTPTYLLIGPDLTVHGYRTDL